MTPRPPAAPAPRDAPQTPPQTPPQIPPLRPPAGLWPGLSLIAPLPGGVRASVWRARDAAGRDWVLKSTGLSEAALDWLTPVQAAARAAGLICPALCRSADGRRAPGGWTAEPFVQGRPGQAADLASLAPRLAAFHAGARALTARAGRPALGAGPLPEDAAPGSPPGPAPGSPPGPLPRLGAAALRAALAPMAGAPEGVIHGDLHPGNLILTAEGPALIDWDEARRDWLFLDQIAARPPTAAEARAALAVEILACLGPEPERAAALTQRLCAAPEPDPFP